MSHRTADPLRYHDESRTSSRPSTRRTKTVLLPFSLFRARVGSIVRGARFDVLCRATKWLVKGVQIPIGLTFIECSLGRDRIVVVTNSWNVYMPRRGLGVAYDLDGNE